MAKLRSYIFIDQLQAGTMCYLGSFCRGFLPRIVDHQLVPSLLQVGRHVPAHVPQSDPSDYCHGISSFALRVP